MNGRESFIAAWRKANALNCRPLSEMMISGMPCDAKIFRTKQTVVLVGELRTDSEWT